MEKLASGAEIRNEAKSDADILENLLLAIYSNSPMKYLYHALILIFCFFAGSGIGYHGFHIYEKYFQKGKTTYSFDLYMRDDGTGYMQYGSDDLLACKILVSE